MNCAELLKNYAADCTARTMQTDFEALGRVAERLIEAKKQGAAIYTAGNGGSHATASHICNDLTKGCRVYNRAGFDAECLGDSGAIATCLANDFCYEDIFKIQIETKAKAGDVLIVFSGSGNSENIVRAVEAAKLRGVTVVGFLGRDGGKLLPLCDLSVVAPTDNMEQIEDMHMLYVHSLSYVLQQKLQEVWGAEIVTPMYGRKFTAALFDWDGTVSCIRSGWQKIMIPYFVEVLEATPQAEDHESIVKVVTDFVDFLTGKQTIFQCIALDEEVQKRGGAAVDPYEYKKEYLRRLEIYIKDRKDALRAGADPAEYRVPGACELITKLQEMGIKCYLASGTDEADVIYEAGLLGMDTAFAGGIHGAQDYMLDCSKELVIKDMIEKEGIKPEELISFGDGYVEIELVAKLGGYAVGAATDEFRRCGVDEWKRNRLLAAGAKMIVPDFADYDRLIAMIKGE
ncbi:MAG: SIS domain-containing protein [Clostridia bacterium]|nr:SIS domain-containing protein [Clostridia bacterium]